MRYHEITHERFRSYPPLMLARSPAMVRTLAVHGADPDGTGGPTHRTALMTAASAGNPAKVKALLAAGASVTRRDKQGFTALLWAVAPLKYEVVPGAEGPYGQIIQTLRNAGADVNARLPDGTSVLGLAARSPHGKIVRILKAAGAKR
jgi:ankyrin repeat protein